MTTTTSPTPLLPTSPPLPHIDNNTYRDHNTITKNYYDYQVQPLYYSNNIIPSWLVCRLVLLHQGLLVLLLHPLQQLFLPRIVNKKKGLDSVIRYQST